MTGIEIRYGVLLLFFDKERSHFVNALSGLKVPLLFRRAYPIWRCCGLGKAITEQSFAYIAAIMGAMVTPAPDATKGKIVPK